MPGELDLDDVQKWIGDLLSTKGTDIFRMKGVLAIAHAKERFVYQGVHMLFAGDFTEPWGKDEPRESKLVFIGRNLVKEELTKAFETCLNTPERKRQRLASLRFKIGDTVECNTGMKHDWSKGTIVALMYRENGMPPGMVVPYQVKLDSGELIFAPVDSDSCVKRAANAA